MPLYLLDTDILSLFQRGHVKVSQAAARHPRDLVRIAAVSAKELIDGRAAAIHQVNTPERLAESWANYANTVTFLSRFPIVPLSGAAILRFQTLMKMKLGVGGNDLRIASTALEAGATAVTRNVRDFSRVPGLLIEDWSA